MTTTRRPWQTLRECLGLRFKGADLWAEVAIGDDGRYRWTISHEGAILRQGSNKTRAGARRSVYRYAGVEAYMAALLGRKA